MRSLTFKLTLAFLAVGLLGVILVAAFVGLRTQREFNQFVLDRYKLDLIDRLAEYYQQNGSWENLQGVAMRGPYRRSGDDERVIPAPLTILDMDRKAVTGGWGFEIGQELTREQAKPAVPIEVDGKSVGFVLFHDTRPDDGTTADSPEAVFVRRVNQAILFGALGAGMIALVLGLLLARTISRPVRELTEATRVVAQGKLGYQVPVRTRDELGQLAESFNQMSSDLAQSSHLRRQMTADIAHELRTPLSIILGYTEALADGKLPGSPDMYQAMHGEARLLNHLIDDLRTLSLADAGELLLNRQLCDPRGLLQRTAASFAAQAEVQQIAVDVQADEGLPAVSVDPERMAQVLGNLVSNALRFTPAGGTIVLAGEATPDAVLLRVQDSGAGIAPEHLPHIFERFYQADPSRESSETGESGLGLAIAKSIVEAHGLSIAVNSTLGQGATFTIRCPLSPAN